MGEFIKSAFGYFGSTSSGNKENELVGQTIEVGKQVYRIRKVIAEGGYAVVFDGYDAAKGKSVAIKRLIAHDQDTCKVVMNEIDILKKINGHQNIIQFFNVAVAGREKFKHIGTEFLIVTELCSGGGLQDYLPPPHQQQTLSSTIVLQILTQTSLAVQHLHKQSPPIIHRDLKVENLLLSNTFTIKLCDFGSASTQTYTPTISWSANERGRVQEDLERITTPMYRAPEMLDLYLNYPINEALDIWALGCVFFYMLCGYHPFEDSSKLAILNANYNLPPCVPETEPLHNLIRQMLLVDPTQRTNINVVYGELSDLATARNVDTSDSIIFNDDVKRRLRSANSRSSDVSNPGSAPKVPVVRPPRPPPATRISTASPIQNQSALPQKSVPSQHHFRPNHSSPADTHGGSAPSTAANVFGFLKGSAGHLMKNIREVSSKVMETVNATMPLDLDFQYITSRIAVMSFPAESGFEVLGTRNSMEEAQAYLEKHHPISYAVYNLSPRGYRSDQWFGGRVSHRPLDVNRAPSLSSIVELCQNARLWLLQKSDNICVVHCTDGRQVSGVLVCCLLCFCNVFSTAHQAIDFFISKRGPVSFTSSQIRYIDYIAKLVSSPPEIPHNHPLVLFSITLSPIPTFNRLKIGCRPYVDVYQDGKKIYSSLIDYESLRTYVLEDRRMEMILNGISVYGDIIIVVSHARSLFAGKGKAAAARICQFQFHTGFVGKDTEKISFMKSEMDHLHPASNPSSNRYAASFHASLHLMTSPHEKPRQGSTLIYPWETLPSKTSRRPQLCFSDEFEMRSVVPAGNNSSDADSPLNVNKATVKPTALPTTSESSSDEDEVLSTPSHGGLIVNEHAASDSRPESSAAEEEEDRVSSPSLSNVLIEGLDWSQAPSGTPQQPPKSPTPVNNAFFTSCKPSDIDPSVADLLGFSSQVDTSSPDHKSSPLDKRRKPSGESKNNEELFDDFFTSNDTPATSWEDPWLNSSTSNNTSVPTNSNPFDPFGTATCPPEVFDPFNTQPSLVNSFMHQSNSTSNLAGATIHPDMHQFASSSNLGPQSKTKPNKKNPFDEFDVFFGAAANAAKGQSSNSPSPAHKSNTIPTPTATAASTSRQGFGVPPPSSHPASTFQPTAPPNADYSSNSFRHNPPSSSTASPHHQTPSTGGFRSSGMPSGTGTGPKIEKNAFADLLGGFGSDPIEEPALPKTMAEMRKAKLVLTTDPDSLKVSDWMDGKERNVRALLCTIPNVMWEGVRWEKISMADVMTVKQVKQQYRKAARAVHPDKWMNSEHENLARLILTELNDAMAEFERLEQTA